MTGGDITPTGASVGTKQGFSIVTWDTASLSGTKSISTGLTQAPEFVITKVLNQADDWLTFHKDLSSTESLILNGDRAKLSNAAYAHTFNSDGTISGLPVGGSNWWILIDHTSFIRGTVSLVYRNLDHLNQMQMPMDPM